MVCPGGELAFVSQMVKDSLKLQGRVHWYSSMVGKKATLKQLRRMLHQSNITALRTTELVQVSTAYVCCEILCHSSVHSLNSFCCPMAKSQPLATCPELQCVSYFEPQNGIEKQCKHVELPTLHSHLMSCQGLTASEDDNDV